MVGVSMTAHAYDTSTAPEYSQDDEDRYARARARHLERVSELRPVVCLTLSYRELGYSRSGIAKRMETSESTVLSRLEEASENYGLDVVESRPQLNPVEGLQ